MAEVFISYSRRDKDFVRQLGEALVSQQREAWVDWKDIPLTAEWQQEIFTNIESADNFIFIISPDSVASPNCKREIDHAVSNNKRMIPIYFREVRDDEVPNSLARFQRLDFTDSSQFDGRFQTLVKALDTDLLWTQAHTRLLTRAKEWERAGKDSSFVLRGKDLQEAERWIAKSSEREPKPSTLQSQYVLASRQSATRAQRVIIAATAIAFLIAVGLAIYAFRQKNVAQFETGEAQRQRGKAEENARKAEENANEATQQKLAAQASEKNAEYQRGIAEDQKARAVLQAKIATSRQLAAESQQSLSNDLGLALQKVVEGMRQYPTEEARAELGRVLEGALERSILPHDDVVLRAEFSPDGRMIATASADTTVRIWDGASGRKLVALHGHSKQVRGAHFSSDGQKIVTASADGTARVWNVRSGEILAVLQGQKDGIVEARFSPDGKKIITVGDDGTARVWDSATGNSLITLSRDDADISDAVFFPDGSRVLTATVGAAVIWDAVTGHPVVRFGDKGPQIVQVALSSDGKTVATASSDGTARLWAADTGGLLASLQGHSGVVMHAAFSPDAKRVVTASRDQTVRVWNVDSGTSVATLKGHSDWVLDAEFSPDGQRIVSASADGTSRVWDIEACAKLNIPCDARVTLLGHTRPLYQANFSPDGSGVITASADHTARLWDIEIGHPLSTLRSEHKGPAFDMVLAAALSPGATRAVTIQFDGRARIWSVPTSRMVSILDGSLQEVVEAAFSSDAGQVVIVSGGWEAPTTKVWNVATGRLLAELKVRSIHARFLPDGKRVVTVRADGTKQVWEVASGRELAAYAGLPRLQSAQSAKPGWLWSTEGGEVGLLSKGEHATFIGASAGPTDVSPDRKRMVTTSDRTMGRLWEVESGRPVAELTGHSDMINDVVFSPDGKRIVTVSDDKTARVWDARSGHSLLVLAGHQDRVLKAAVSPDSTQVVTSSADGTARIWDLKSGHLQAKLMGHTGSVFQAAFSSDGKYIIIPSSDGSATVYIVDSGELLKRAEQDIPKVRGLR